MFSTLIIKNISWAANQHIRMISEESCDTEDWSNDAENSALHYKNKLHLKKYSTRKQIFQIVILFHNIKIFLLHFWYNKCSLGELKKLYFKNITKNLTEPKLLNSIVYKQTDRQIDRRIVSHNSENVKIILHITTLAIQSFTEQLGHKYGAMWKPGRETRVLDSRCCAWVSTEVLSPAVPLILTCECVFVCVCTALTFSLVSCLELFLFLLAGGSGSKWGSLCAGLRVYIRDCVLVQVTLTLLSGTSAVHLCVCVCVWMCVRDRKCFIWVLSEGFHLCGTCRNQLLLNQSHTNMSGPISAQIKRYSAFRKTQ